MSEVEIVERWQCPSGTGIPLITMPNVPRPLHGPGCQPRTIFGQATWDRMRKRAYFDAGYKCEICGCEPEKKNLHAHELYTVDYKAGTSKFERVIAICRTCHDGIHSGRLITMYKNKNPLYPKSYVLRVAENCFSLVNQYNKTHEGKIKVYSTYLDYLKVPSIASEMAELIEKYGIEFYNEPKKCAKWEDWKLLIGEKEYPTPYKDQHEWEVAMRRLDKTDNTRNIKNPFSGGIFDKVHEIAMRVGTVESIPGCKSGRLSKRACIKERLDTDKTP